MPNLALLALEASDGTVVLTSITLVFAMLVALCLIITLEGKIFDAINNKKNNKPAAPKASAAPAAKAAPAPAAAAAPVVTGAGEPVTAPMPGTILKVNVTQGQAVKAGTVLCILEAMKMENEIMTSKDGTVTQVLVSKGSAVDTGAPLVVIG